MIQKKETIPSTLKSVLRAEEVAELIGISKGYLYKLTSARQIPYYKPRGGGIYFKREEVEQWMLRNRRATREELAGKVEEYEVTGRKEALK